MNQIRLQKIVYWCFFFLICLVSPLSSGLSASLETANKVKKSKSKKALVDNNQELTDLIADLIIEETKIEVDGRSYRILKLKNSIDPKTLEVISDSDSIKIYVYGDVNKPVADSEIAKKIGVIDRAHRFVKNSASPSIISEQIKSIDDRWNNHRWIDWLGFVLDLLSESASITINSYIHQGTNIPNDVLESATRMFLDHYTEPGWVLEQIAKGDISNAKKEFNEAKTIASNGINDFSAASSFFKHYFNGLANDKASRVLLDEIDSINKSSLDEFRTLTADIADDLGVSNFGLFEKILDTFKTHPLLDKYHDIFIKWNIENYEKATRLNETAKYTLAVAKSESGRNVNKPSQAPTLATPSNNSDHVSITPTFEWYKVTGATKYGVYISKPPYGPENLVYDSESDYGPISETSFTPTVNLKNGVKYRWNVRAGNDGGWGPYSSKFYFTTENNIDRPKQAPVHLSPSNSTNNVSKTPTFEWEGVSGATKYALYISKPPYGPENVVYDSEQDYGPISETSLNPSISLEKGVTYRWNMRAGNEGGWGPFSSTWSFTIPNETSGFAYISSGINVNPTSINPDENFEVSFTLNERQGASITFTAITAAIYDANWNHLFNLESQSDVTISANGTWEYSTNASKLNNTGTYKIAAQGFVDNNWFDFATTEAGVNPVEIQVVSQKEPNISVSPTSLSFGKVKVGTNSTPMNYTVTGSNLTTNISIEAPTGFQISLSSSSNFQSSMKLEPQDGNLDQTIYVRFSPQNVQLYKGDISHSSSETTNRKVTLSGKGISDSTLPPDPPQLVNPSNEATYTSTSPMFKWDTSDNAISYQLEVDEDTNFTSPLEENISLSSTSHKITDLDYDATYYWRVNASNEAGSSNWSEVFSFTTIEKLDANWIPQQSNTFDRLNSVQFLDKNTGWVVGENGTILKTTNGGTDWISQRSDVNTTLGDVFFVDEEVGWAVGGDGTILKSTNGGLDWSKQNSGISKDLSALHFIDSKIGWIAGEDGLVLKTTDGGDNWISQNVGTSAFLNDVFFSNAENGWVTGLSQGQGVVLHTADGGTEWNQEKRGPASSFTAIYFRDSDTGWSVGTDGTILKTSNGGADWSSQNSKTGKTLQNIHFIDSKTGWAVGHDGIILKTTNGGIDWIPVTSKTEDDLLSVHFVDEQNGWVLGDRGIIHKYTTGPQPPKIPTLSTPAKNSSGISTSPTFSWEASEGAETYHIQISEQPDFSEKVLDELNLTEESYNEADLSPNTKYYWRVRAVNNDVKSSWSKTWSFATIEETEDSWIVQNPGTRQTLQGIHFIDLEVGWIVGTGSTILKTTNGGADWLIQDSPSDQVLEDVYFIDSQSGWIVGYSGTILKTSNGGTDWLVQQSGTNETLSGVYFANSKTGWAVGEGGTVLKTIDGGTTWDSQDSGDGLVLEDVYFANSDTGWIADAHFEILKTTNGGIDWTSQDTDVGLLAIDFADNETGWAVGDQGTILKTVDGGINWSAQESGISGFLSDVQFANSQMGWAVAGDGTILKSTNGGTDWLSIDSKTEESLYAAYFVDDQTGWVVGSGGTILKYTSTTQIPETPLLVSPENGATEISSNPTFEWKSSKGAKSYQIQVSEQLDFTNIEVDESSLSKITFSYNEKLSLNTHYYWRVRATNQAGSSSWSDTFSFTTGEATSIADQSNLPNNFKLYNPYPTPFNPRATIKYDLPKASAISIKVYNILGKQVQTLVNKKQSAGTYTVRFNAGDLPSGQYLIRMQAGSGFVEEKSVMLVK